MEGNRPKKGRETAGCAHVSAGIIDIWKGGRPKPLQLAGAAVLAAILLLTAAASIITIGSAVLREPEKPNIVRMDDLPNEEMDLGCLLQDPNAMEEIEP